jgi:hypothetical protein
LCRCARAGCLAFAGDARDDGVDADGLAFLRDDLGQRAGRRRGNLGVDFVRRDLEERFIALDFVARLLEPLDDRSFGD